jgi:host factor-I protein
MKNTKNKGKIMGVKRKRVQETFLNTARKEKVRLTIYLINGIKLEGKIRYYDQYTILLKEGNRQILVFKHAIATIIPKRDIEVILDEE